MNQKPQFLNQYTGFDSNGNSTVVVAENMETAVKVYVDQMDEDPVQMQTTKKQIRCVLPDTYTTFTTDVWDETGGAKLAGCTATPKQYRVIGGSSQIFTATAAEGWTFVKWQIDGVDVEGGTEPVMPLVIPTKQSGECTIKAVFEQTP